MQFALLAPCHDTASLTPTRAAFDPSEAEVVVLPSRTDGRAPCGDGVVPPTQEAFGWSVDETGSLQMGGGMVGVLVQSTFAGATAEYLQRQESCGPVLDLGPGVDGWVFLADPNELVLSQSEMPPGVDGCPAHRGHRRAAVPAQPVGHAR